jgi:hypothetical protein
MFREVTTEFVVVRPPPHVPVHHQAAIPRLAVVARHLPPPPFPCSTRRARRTPCPPALETCSYQSATASPGGGVVLPLHLFGGAVVPSRGDDHDPSSATPPLVGPINCPHLARVVRPRGEIPRRRRRPSRRPNPAMGIDRPPQHFQRERIVDADPRPPSSAIGNMNRPSTSIERDVDRGGDRRRHPRRYRRSQKQWPISSDRR